MKASEAFSCSDKSLVSGKLTNQPPCEQKGDPSDAQIPVAPAFSIAQALEGPPNVPQARLLAELLPLILKRFAGRSSTGFLSGI